MIRVSIDINIPDAEENIHLEGDGQDVADEIVGVIAAMLCFARDNFGPDYVPIILQEAILQTNKVPSTYIKEPDDV